MRGKKILLIIGGGIAAYKSLELIRRLAERGVKSRTILTHAGAELLQRRRRDEKTRAIGHHQRE